MLDTSQIVDVAHRWLKTSEPSIRTFMRELCATSSVDGEIADVLERVRQEAIKLHFEDIWTDSMGCLLTAIGKGPVTILYDAHLDTVGIGDADDWDHDPFKGCVVEDVLYARGACDTKGCIPGMLYGLALARDLGLLEGKRVLYYGSLEEQCDGQAPHVLVEVDGLHPDYVVIGEPTNMQVYHGQRGRVEFALHMTGRSAHASMPHLGENPLYKLAPFLANVAALNERLGRTTSPVGSGSVAATDMTCRTASINAVPSDATVFMDRRLALDEDVETVRRELEACVPQEHRGAARLSILHYDEPSYNGFRYPVEKVFPAWTLPRDHPYLDAGLKTYQHAFGKKGKLGMWPASTNGTYWMGVAGIPSIGFGPGELRHAHRPEEQVRMADVVQATLFYALLPAFL